MSWADITKQKQSSLLEKLCDNYKFHHFFSGFFRLHFISLSMESAAVLRSFHYYVGTITNTKRPGTIASKLHTQGFPLGGKLVSSLIKRKETLVTCLKTSDTAVPTKSDNNSPQVPLEKTTPWRATFPSGFEALVMEVCDETEVAELKLKVGDFEMHLKRNTGATSSPAPIFSPPPVQTKPMIVSSPTAPPPSPPKIASEKASPFVNTSSKKSPKLEALEASGATGYVLVSAPTVGSFRRGRTFKGKKQPPISKEGDVIKEGQVIGFLDQFGTELPVKSDVAGEVLKLLFNDGDAVGYGDPLLAVLPSFHGIK